MADMEIEMYENGNIHDRFIQQQAIVPYIFFVIFFTAVCTDSVNKPIKLHFILGCVQSLYLIFYMNFKENQVPFEK